jgi:carbonic anhydrase
MSVSVEDSVRSDVEFLKQSPLVRKELKGSIQGLVFDIETGRLNKVT